MTSLTDRLNAALPQTQCTKCGFSGCKPYASAMARGEAAINRCPPGGQAGIRALAALLDIPETEPDPAYGLQQPLSVAFIDEEHCIGCTLCIQACPVDAIVGASKLMHTVLPDLCTGCDLCVEPCPVDCITMIPANSEWTPPRAEAARQRYEQRQTRLQKQHPEPSPLAAAVLANKDRLSPKAQADQSRRKQVASQALARARARRKQLKP